MVRNLGKPTNDFMDEKCGVSCLTKKWWRDQKCEANQQVLGVVEKIKTLISKNLTTDDDW